MPRPFINLLMNVSKFSDPDEWTPITPPDGWVLLPSVSTANATKSNSTETTTAMTANTTTADVPSIVMFPDDTPTVISEPPVMFPGSTLNPNFTTWEDIQKNISASSSTPGDLSSMSTPGFDEFTMRPELNMSDYLQGLYMFQVFGFSFVLGSFKRSCNVCYQLGQSQSHGSVLNIKSVTWYVEDGEEFFF